MIHQSKPKRAPSGKPVANFVHLRAKLGELCNRRFEARAKAARATQEADQAQEAYHRGIVAAWEAATSMDDSEEVRLVASLMLHVPLELRPNVSDAFLADFLNDVAAIGPKGGE